MVFVLQFLFMGLHHCGVPWVAVQRNTFYSLGIKGKSMIQLMWFSAAHLCPTLPSALVEILAFLNHSDPKLIPSLSMPPSSRWLILSSFSTACTYTSWMSRVKPRLSNFYHLVYWGICGWPRRLFSSLLVEWMNTWSMSLTFWRK